MSTRTFGDNLRDWRRTRGLSQLELASRAGVSQRHVSFIETGKAKPSREMVIHLGHTLEIPFREQNLLLLAAGHAPEFRETPLDGLGHLSAVLDTMLEAHLPHMAVIVDRRWDLVRFNDAAAAFTARLFSSPPAWIEPPLNLMRLSLHPDGLRPHMREWERSAGALLRRLRRDAASHPHDRQLQALLEEVLAYPDVVSLPDEGRAARAGDLLIPTTYVVDGVPISLFTTIAIIGDAHDLTLAELRLETFWPVDEESDRAWREAFA